MAGSPGPAAERAKVAFLRPLPVRALYGVGKVTKQVLVNAGLKTVGDLQDYQGDLRALVGSFARRLRQFAVGHDGDGEARREAQRRPDQMNLAHDTKYEVVRTQRRTADVVIERDGRVLVRAPKSIGKARIEDIVERKRIWIYKNLAEWRDLNATRVLREYRNGEGFLYLGRSYRLLLVADQEELLRLKQGRFCLRRDLVDEGGIPAAQSAFRAFYSDQGRERITRRVNYFAPKVGVAAAKVAVRELGHRWAACSPKGNLAFHWKCMMAPPTIIDYIIVHELCHIHHLDHTQAFWNEVDKVMSDYQERKDWLKRNGAAMDV